MDIQREYATPVDGSDDLQQESSTSTSTNNNTSKNYNNIQVQNIIMDDWAVVEVVSDENISLAITRAQQVLQHLLSSPQPTTENDVPQCKTELKLKKKRIRKRNRQKVSEKTTAEQKNRAFCEFTSENSDEFRIHDLKHLYTIYECKHCSYFAKTRPILNAHIEKNHSVELQCAHCYFTTIAKRDLVIHLKFYCRNYRQYKCELREELSKLNKRLITYYYNNSKCEF